LFSSSPHSPFSSVLPTEYTECQAFFLVVHFGPPPPHPQGSVAPPTLVSLAGEGLGGPNSDEGIDTLVLYTLQRQNTEISKQIFPE
jgi:hypothetical protein